MNDDSNENYIQVRVENTPFNLHINNKTQLIDTRRIISPNTGGYLLQRWLIQCIDKNGTGKIHTFVRSTQSTFPTGNSGASSLRPIGDAFMYIETSSNNISRNVFFCSWERLNLINISNLTLFLIVFQHQILI